MSAEAFENDETSSLQTSSQVNMHGDTVQTGQALLPPMVNMPAVWRNSQQHVFRCAADGRVVTEAPPSQPAPMEGRNMSADMTAILAKAALMVDMAYVLCVGVGCSTLQIPRGTHNIRIVQAHEVDRCLQDTALDHWSKASFAHKVAVAHGMLNDMPSIAVLEDDLQINRFPDFIELGRSIHQLFAENKEQIVRFTGRPDSGDLVDNSGKCIKSECRCAHTENAPDLCSLKKGCPHIHDASWYMMLNTTYQAFLESPGAVIDNDVMAAFDSVLVVPPITLQKAFACHGDWTRKCHAEDQLHHWSTYERACLYDL